MSFRPKSYEFDADGTYSSNVSTVTFNYSTATVNIDTCVVQISDLSNVKIAISELIGQPADPVTDNKKTTAGGIVVQWVPAPTETIQVGALPVWVKAKAQSLIDLLVALGY
jgi:hypothetical protein